MFAVSLHCTILYLYARSIASLNDKARRQMPPFCYMQNDNEAQSALNIEEKLYLCG
jgi:hypothetical protein